MRSRAIVSRWLASDSNVSSSRCVAALPGGGGRRRSLPEANTHVFQVPAFGSTWPQTSLDSSSHSSAKLGRAIKSEPPIPALPTTPKRSRSRRFISSRFGAVTLSIGIPPQSIDQRLRKCTMQRRAATEYSWLSRFPQTPRCGVTAARPARESQDGLKSCGDPGLGEGEPMKAWLLSLRGKQVDRYRHDHHVTGVRSCIESGLPA